MYEFYLYFIIKCDIIGLMISNEEKAQEHPKYVVRKKRLNNFKYYIFYNKMDKINRTLINLKQRE